MHELYLTLFAEILKVWTPKLLISANSNDTYASYVQYIRNTYLSIAGTKRWNYAFQKSCGLTLQEELYQEYEAMDWQTANAYAKLLTENMIAFVFSKEAEGLTMEGLDIE